MHVDEVTDKGYVCKFDSKLVYAANNFLPIIGGLALKLALLPPQCYPFSIIYGAM